jgi:4-carboxymuconolactone decarboxylase
VSRLPRFVPGALTPSQSELYESIAGGPRAQGPQHFALTAPDGSLNGPFNALLVSPELGGAIQELGAAVRYRTGLTAREREIAILIVATHWQSAFEIMAHEAVGRAAGLTDAELATIAAGDVPELADEHELLAAQVTHALARGDVDDVLWAAATAVLDDVTVFELTTLVGYYALLALQLRVFRV